MGNLLNWALMQATNPANEAQIDLLDSYALTNFWRFENGGLPSGNGVSGKTSMTAYGSSILESAVGVGGGACITTISGVNAFIAQAMDSSMWSPTERVAISCWVRRATTGALKAQIIQGHYTYSNRMFEFDINNAAASQTCSFGGYASGGPYYTLATASATLPASAWRHLLVCYDLDNNIQTTRMLIDGTLVLSDASLDVSTSVRGQGLDVGVVTNFGRVDEVSVLTSSAAWTDASAVALARAYRDNPLWLAGK